MKTHLFCSKLRSENNIEVFVEANGEKQVKFCKTKYLANEDRAVSWFQSIKRSAFFLVFHPVGTR